MKRIITLSIALVLSVVLLSLMSSDSTVKADRNRAYRADTGFIALGPNQILRLTVAPRADGSLPTESLSLNFDKITYRSQGSCDPVCILVSSIPGVTDPVTLMPGEAASIDIGSTPSSVGVRGIVVSNSRNMQVNALVIDAATGAVQAWESVAGGEMIIE